MIKEKCFTKEGGVKKRKKKLKDQMGEIQTIAHKLRKNKMVGMMGKNLVIEPDPNPPNVSFLSNNGLRENVI